MLPARIIRCYRSMYLFTPAMVETEQRVKLQDILGHTYHSLGLPQQAIPLQEKVRDWGVQKSLKTVILAPLYLG